MPQNWLKNEGSREMCNVFLFMAHGNGNIFSNQIFNKKIYLIYARTDERMNTHTLQLWMLLNRRLFPVESLVLLNYGIFIVINLLALRWHITFSHIKKYWSCAKDLMIIFSSLNLNRAQSLNILKCWEKKGMELEKFYWLRSNLKCRDSYFYEL